MEIGTPVVAFSVIIVILAAGFAYEYATTTNQISRLNSQVSTLSSQVTSVNQSLQSLCLRYKVLSSELGSFGVFLSNETATLQSQIKFDESLIATLDSIRPSGYASMITTLQHQISQDNIAIAQIQGAWMGPGISSDIGFKCTTS